MQIFDLYSWEFYAGMKFRHQFMFLALATAIGAVLVLLYAVIVALIIASLAAITGIFDSLLASAALWVAALSIEVPLVVLSGKAVRFLFLHEFFTGKGK